MITNERQFKITRAELSKMQDALKSFDMQKALADVNGDAVMARALKEALASEVEVLSGQLKEYEALKSGFIQTLVASSLEDLPTLLVKARIAKGLSQKQLADRLGLKEQQIQRYEAERYSSTNLRRLIEISDSLGLTISEQVRLEARGEEETSTEDSIEWSKFPLKEMYRRHWFKEFTGSLRDAEANAQNLIQQFCASVSPRVVNALHRKHVRGGSTLDQYSLIAWQYRVLALAQSVHTRAPFKRSCITTEWLYALAKLSRETDGPRRAIQYLKDSGIVLIIEPHLPKTFLDGAAFLAPNAKSVIGMTLRYDRLDNFWFVLFHELAHLALHLSKGDVEVCFDDLEAAPDAVEKAADQFALEAMISNDKWETSIARYMRTEESVKELAVQLEINPALIAGRIRKEAENYVILGDLIGVGKVRSQFPEVSYGL